MRGYRIVYGGRRFNFGIRWVAKLDLEVGFERRNAQVGQCTRKETVMGNENRWVFPLSPTARGLAKMDGCFAEMKIAQLDFRRPY